MSLPACSDCDAPANPAVYLLGSPYCMAHVTALAVEALEAKRKEPAYTAARGVSPRKPGDPMPEDAIRGIRDGIGAAQAQAERLAASATASYQPPPLTATDDNGRSKSADTLPRSVAHPSPVRVTRAPPSGYTGNACHACGGFQMVRAGNLRALPRLRRDNGLLVGYNGHPATGKP